VPDPRWPTLDGTAGGVAILDPQDPPDSTNAPLVVIEQVRANGEIVFDNSFGARKGAWDSSKTRGSPKPKIQDLESRIQFRPGAARVVEIQYTANLGTTEATLFKYLLEGWDKDWIAGGTSRKAYYANLGPGDYRFRVLAANPRNRWSHREATVAFHVAPFFYQTLSFYGLCGAVTCCGAYLGISSRLRKTRRIAELERRIALDDQRRRIARDIHDELGASLTQIAQLSEGVQELHEQSTTADSAARRIAVLAEEAVGNIGEIVWSNNPRYDTLEDLVAFLREYAAKYLGAASLEARLLFPDEVPALPATGPIRRYLLAILKEALHNVLRHSGARRVEVSLVLNGPELQLSIRDDGGGIDPASESRFGNGLVNIRERCAELGGSCSIVSNPGEGTTLCVKVPLIEKRT
jgi:signal transduction histidine kinase